MASSSIFRFSSLLSSPRFPVCRSLSTTPVRVVVSFGSCLTTSTQHLRRRFFRSMSDDVEGQLDRVDAVPNSFPVRVAHDLLLAGHRYLDVRTPEEFSSGHPIGAVNVPYMYKTSAGMVKNPNFVKDVKSIFEEDTKLIVGCQMGKRSLMAATHLSSSGFTAITDNTGGYSAWKENGFPTQ